MKSFALTSVLTWLFAGYLSFAQPGICPCWLIQDVRHIHPHLDAHPELPHSHAYLFEMFSTMLSTPPPLPEPALELIGATSLTHLRRLLAEPLISGAIWAAPLSPPPPRAPTPPTPATL